MKLPKRPKQHIIESASFKVFSMHVPNEWIVREVTERDYGIDCYLELVTPEGDLTGNLVSVQLKGTSQLKWTKENTYSINSILPSTWNYWYHFPVPVFIFLVDCIKQDVYFQSVSDYIRKNANRALSKNGGYCIIDKNNVFSKGTQILSFIKQYLSDCDRNKFEDNLLTFIANLRIYMDFIEKNAGRDFFMGVNMERECFALHMRNIFEFLSTYLGIEWSVPTFKELQSKGQKIFGDAYSLYEATLTELLEALSPNIKLIINRLKYLITEKEHDYWCIFNNNLLNYFNNLGDEEIMPWHWTQ